MRQGSVSKVAVGRYWTEIHLNVGRLKSVAKDEWQLDEYLLE
jgi:hypothetical protein